MIRRIAVRAIILDDDGKIFCMKLRDKKTRQPLKHWCLPGGGLDPAESLVDGLHREMIEETDVAPKIGELLFIQQYLDGGKEHIEFFFHVTNTSDYQNIDISSATHAEEEVAEYGFIDTMQTYVLPELLQKEDIASHIKSGQPTKLFDYL